MQVTTHALRKGAARSFFLDILFHRTTYNDVNILGSVVTNPIIIVNYDQSWPKLYHLFSKRFADSLGDIAAAIEHIGSTAVPGLAAKPVIDIDVLSSDKRTSAHGYRTSRQDWI